MESLPLSPKLRYSPEHHNLLKKSYKITVAASHPFLISSIGLYINLDFLATSLDLSSQVFQSILVDSFSRTKVPRAENVVTLQKVILI
jgi:hypothetical protein